mmetsp:Transcript_17407/g.22644  ORF Transcript_17407/g.22644 Transcript_17407/m.22644 type:complete len:829 (+) Transcript_17407:52-2538(+)
MKKRGRPRKTEVAPLVNIPEVSLEDEEEILEPLPPKKKRGRPRKSEQQALPSPIIESTLTLRKRGRPRKEEIPNRSPCSAKEKNIVLNSSISSQKKPRKNDDAISSSTAVIVKKRGRPRKEEIKKNKKTEAQSPKLVQSLELRSTDSASSTSGRSHRKKKNDAAKSQDKKSIVYYQPEIDLFATPSYAGYTVPQAEREDLAFARESIIERVQGRENWIALLPELVMVCNEAARRATMQKNPRAKFFDKPLAADYMYDRLNMSLDEPRGLVCRHRETQTMQGFIVLSVFASWDKTLRWSSSDPRAWGVSSYDAYASRRSGTKSGGGSCTKLKSMKSSSEQQAFASNGGCNKNVACRKIGCSSYTTICTTGGISSGPMSENHDDASSSVFDSSTVRDDDDDAYDSDSASSNCSLDSLRGVLGKKRLKRSERTACELRIRALVDAADAAAAIALHEAQHERRDDDGILSQALESSERQVCESDDRFLEWPGILEITLLGGLGCGRRLVETAIEKFCFAGEMDADRQFLVLQATHNAIHFYEQRGFVRVGALAKYRDRRDMPELAYRHWNDRITVGSQAHGASYMMALDLFDYKKKFQHGNTRILGYKRDIKSTTLNGTLNGTKKKRKNIQLSEDSRAHVALIAEAAMMANTNVVGGSSVFRELVVLAQGHAGKYGANDPKLERALATSLLVFKSNSCGTSKRILRTKVLHLPDEPPSVNRSRLHSGIRGASKPKPRPNKKIKESLFIKLRLQSEDNDFIDTRPQLKACAKLKGDSRRSIYNVVLSTRLAAKIADKQRLFQNHKTPDSSVPSKLHEQEKNFVSTRRTKQTER